MYKEDITHLLTLLENGKITLLEYHSMLYDINFDREQEWAEARIESMKQEEIVEDYYE